MSINENRLPLEQASAIACRIEEILSSAGVTHTVCGSLRRGKPTIGDLDIVVSDLVTATTALGAAGYATHLPKPRKGKIMRQGGATVDGLKVGLYHATFYEWGAMVLTYTGNHLLNIQMRAEAKRQGYLLNQYGVWHNGIQIAGISEEQMFYVLGLEYLEPKDREFQQWTKLKKEVPF